ncbi:MAG: hypothetical protein E6Q97_25425 [Desulfurellales bacterium]|nr:MAG: hypothetical protein E6Q97_25425 [Desulfurellales bacterium]
MRFRYFLKVAGADGQNRNIVDDFLRLSFTKRLNGVGLLTFDLPANHDSLADYEIDSIITVERGQKHPSISSNYYFEFVGLYRGMRKQADRDGRRRVTIYAQDGMSLLARAIIAWKAGQNGYSQWSNTKVDSIIAQIIQTNYQSASGRVLTRMTASGGFTRLFLNPLGTPASTTIDYAAAYKNVLAAVQELTEINNDVVEVRKSGGDGWTVYINSMGTDRTDSVIFDLGYSNMVNADLDLRRLNEPTKAVVAGQGEGSTRLTVVQTSANWSEYNHNEIFVDARDQSTTAVLQARGDAKLAEEEYRPKFVFNPAQTPACRYGKHYYLGDTITARFEGESFAQKIVGVTMAVDEQGRESPELELDDA